jgi:hypothetical protein
MAYFKAFQVLLMIGLVLAAIFEARAMIVEDDSSGRWGLIAATVTFCSIYVGVYLEKRRHRATQAVDNVEP